MATYKRLFFNVAYKVTCVYETHRLHPSLRSLHRVPVSGGAVAGRPQPVQQTLGSIGQVRVPPSGQRRVLSDDAIDWGSHV